MQCSTQRDRRNAAALAPAARMASTLAVRSAIGALAIFLVSAPTALAANFSPISGALSIRAGEHTLQTTPVVIGSTSLTDNTFPQGFDVASASMATSLFAGAHFNFAGAASSLTTAVNPPVPRATAQVSLQQSFTTATQQWIQVTAKVLSPADVATVSAYVLFTGGGKPPIFVPHTAGLERSFAGLYPAGAYSLTAAIDTAATQTGSHAGAVSGSVLVASLADFNGNLVVDGTDLVFWRNGFSPTGATFAHGNVDGDGDSDGADFLLWQRQMGTHALASGAAQAIPEPRGGVLAVAGALAAIAVASGRRKPPGITGSLRSPLAC